MTLDAGTCLTLFLGCLAVVPVLGAIVWSGYVYQVQRAQIRLLQEEKDGLARRLDETQQAANIPTAFLTGFEPPAIPPERLADLQQLTRRLGDIQAIPSLPLLPSVRFLADEYLNLAVGYYHLKNYEKVIELLNKALQLDPGNAPLYYSNRGVAYAYLSQHEQALKDYDRALELKPDFPEALVNRGNAYDELGQYEWAIQDYDKALEFKPDDYEALTNRGAAYDHLGQYERAIRDYDKALELKPDCHQALNNRGLAYAYQGRHARGIQDLKRALGLKPDDPSKRYNMACVYSLMNKPDEALKWLREAIDLDQKFRDMAKSDSDFDNIRDDPRFKELVGE